MSETPTFAQGVRIDSVEIKVGHTVDFVFTRKKKYACGVELGRGIITAIKTTTCTVNAFGIDFEVPVQCVNPVGLPNLTRPIINYAYLPV